MRHHIIKKQLIDLTLDNRLDHFRMQQLVSEHFRNDIVPLLEKLFDKAGAEDEIIEIDRLEIDLGVLTEKSIEKKEWTAGLQSRIEALLSEITHPFSSPSSSVEKVRKQPKRLNVFRQWLFYMQRGYLPWNTLQPDDAWYLQVIEALAVDFESMLLLQHLIRTEPAVLKRIIAQHQASFLLNLAEIFTAQSQRTLPVAIQELTLLSIALQRQQKMPFVETELAISKRLWSQVITLAAIPRGNDSALTLLDRLVASFVREYVIMKKPPLRISAPLNLTLPLIEECIETEKAKRKTDDQKIAKTVKELEARSGKKAADEEGPPLDEIKKTGIGGQLAHSGEEAIAEAFPNSNIKLIDEEGIFATHAGLVLLHPFLKHLFGRLGWIAEGVFSNAQAHLKALYLLHYLATGNLQAEEYELVISKVLCSWPLDEPVDGDIELSTGELAEADDMLLAAIQQWEILKNTSPAGLREGFLQRAGKLCSRHGNLYLQVEASSIDMLLDRLPWNLSMVRLPWMKDILRVEWR